MRVHAGVAVGTARSDQSWIVLVNHREKAKYNPSEPGGELEHIVIGIEPHPPRPADVETRLLTMARDLRLVRPCLFVDASSGSGAALASALKVERGKRGNWPADLHPVHPYVQRGAARQALLEAILTAYMTGMLAFEEGLVNRDRLEKALASQQSVVGIDGRVSRKSDDDNLIIALGLAIAYAQHGAPPEFECRSGLIVLERRYSPEPY
jgi:hypothetical protein